MFRIIFVVDISDGVVVHARGGKREEYRPVSESSRVCSSSLLHEVLKDVSPMELYVADLNRIVGTGSNLNLLKDIKVPMMVDAGIKEIEDVYSIVDIFPPSCKLILGTETVPLKTMESLLEIEKMQERYVISIDTIEGKLLSPDKIDLMDACDYLSQFAFEDYILLDLSAVGSLKGVDDSLISNVMNVLEKRVMYGGGVHTVNDLKHLKTIGTSGALVASAVHNGDIPLNIIQKGI